MASYKAVPSARGSSLIGRIGSMIDLIKAGSGAQVHNFIDQRHRQLGPIFREVLGGTTEAVFVQGGELTRQVFSQEGKYPKNLLPEPWVIYNKKFNRQRGLFFMRGEEWAKYRSIMNRIFLPSKKVQEELGFSQLDTCSEAIEDAVSRFGVIRQSSDHVIPNLEKEMYRLSMAFVTSVLFGRTDKDIFGGRSELFSECVRAIFNTSAQMTLIPPTLASRFNLPVWKNFCYAVDNALAISKSVVESRLEELQAGDCPESLKKCYLNKLREEKLSTEEILKILIDLVIAAGDTTSHSTQWTLYLLGKHQDVQAKLYTEIQNRCGKDEILSIKHLEKINYLQWIIKESMRLYPVATFLTRQAEHDTTVDKYIIPKGKLIIMSMYSNARDESCFEDAYKFWPERWQRISPVKTPGNLTSKTRLGIEHPFGTLPFGTGPRMCIGRKISEAQMHLFIGRMVQRYQLEINNTKDVEYVMRFVGVPSEEIQLRVNDRP